MADKEISDILTGLITRQSDVEKVQATQGQVLQNLVQSSEHLVDRVEKVEESLHGRFDRLEERQRFPIGHVLTIIGIFITLVGITMAGFAYFINLSYAPTQIQLDNLQKQVEQLEGATKIQFREDDQREGDDKARFGNIESHNAQQESLQDNLHKTVRIDLTDLKDRVRELEKYCWIHNPTQLPSE